MRGTQRSRARRNPASPFGLPIAYEIDESARICLDTLVEHVVTSGNERYHRDPTKDRLEKIFERALTAYHRDELHGGAHWVGERVLDAELVPVAREAFLDADDLPADQDVLQIFDSEPMQLLGEGYHVIALVEPSHRFVVKYAKHLKPVPPLARPAAPHSRSGSTITASDPTDPCIPRSGSTSARSKPTVRSRCPAESTSRTACSCCSRR